MIECRLLGAVEVRVGQRSVDVGQPRQRAVLAALAVDAGRLVPLNVLIDRVWDASPPANARDAVYSHVARVRRGLNEASELAGTRVGLVRRFGGYLLDIDPDHVDLHRFRTLADQARTPGREDDERVTLLREALGLWRGVPLTGMSGQWAARSRQAWQQQRLDAVIAWASAEITVGNAAGILSALADLLGEHPLVEPLAAAYMRALHAAGHGAQALDCYAATRRRLAEDLGADPGPQLQDLHQAILRGDLPSPPTTATPPTDVDARMVPAQLPPDVHGFAGRGEELGRLHDLLTSGGDQPTTVVISALSGTAGVGKTALAVHFAHQVADRFPDGQLYVNLHGFSAAGSVRSPAEVIRMFLEALEVPPQQVPASLDGQAALYRSRLAGTRMLILLDNARDAEQVRPLLPGAPTCLVVVTSRSQLTGLTITEGARPLIVDLLTVEEARQLLAARLGHPRVAVEPDATTEIIECCARLPLALSIVAARAAAHTTFPLTTFAAELRDARSRLDALAGDDPLTDVRSVFSWSYHALTPDAARLFRLLGLPPGPDITAPAVASLTALPLHKARPLLAELARTNLIVEHTPGRYAFHDLLRTYATDLAHHLDPDEQRHTATHRLLDHYLHTAYTADRLLNRVRTPIALTPPQSGVTPEHLTDYDQAVAWLTTERHVLLAAVDHAVATGFDIQTGQLSWILWTFHVRQGHWHDLVATSRAAMTAAQRLADPAAQARAHLTLADALSLLRCLDDAHTHLMHAVDLYVQLDDQAGQAHIHLNLAYLRERQGRPTDALHHARQALDLHRATGHQRGQAWALNMMGWYHALLGDHQQALTYCKRAQALFDELGDREGQANTWDSIAYAHHRLGNHTQAVACYQHALDLFHALGDRYNQADIGAHLGDTYHAAGNTQAARAAWQDALTILTDIDHPDAEAVRAKLHHLDHPDTATSH
jgi:DNA-binding SARP family transcriptional activator